MAMALKWFIERVLQNATAWLSSGDLSPGRNWIAELDAVLKETETGVLCLTRENLNSPWILFEAGGLSTKGKSRVIPFLLDIELDALRPPLSQLQALKASDEADSMRLVDALNRDLSTPLSDDALRETFYAWWPEFSKRLNDIPQSSLDPPKPPPAEEVLPMILDRLTSLERRLTTTTISVDQEFGALHYLLDTTPGHIPMDSELGVELQRTLGAMQREWGELNMKRRHGGITTMQDER
jgi:hypothetical protein